MSWMMATVYDRFMARREQGNLAAWRADLLADIEGVVLEVGAGTGANLSHYGPLVQRLLLAEPDGYMRRRLSDALPRRHARCPVHILAAPAEQLPLAAQSVDAVVVTLVLCSVRSLPRALSEIARVLRPGGRLLFLEHAGAAVGTWRHRCQRIAEAPWRLVAGNCHLTRRPDVALRASGFEVEWMTWDAMEHAGPLLARCVRGVARQPTDTPRGPDERTGLSETP